MPKLSLTKPQAELLWKLLDGQIMREDSERRSRIFTEIRERLEAATDNKPTKKIVHATRLIRPVIQTKLPYDVPLCGRQTCTRTNMTHEPEDVTCKDCKAILARHPTVKLPHRDG